MTCANIAKRWHAEGERLWAEFERTGQVKHYRAWRVHRDAMNIALLKKLITEAARRAFK